MKKFYLLSISLLLIFGQALSCNASSRNYTTGPVSVAIKKYKIGNYTGCLQDTQIIVKNDPSNVVAYYYMAMSYSQAGKKDKAIESYQKVLSLNPNATLARYATMGKRCLETPDKCKETDQSSEIDKLIATPTGDGLSAKVRADLEQKRLESVREEINNGKDINDYQLRQFKDYTNQHSQADTSDKVADKQPTNDEIVAALKVLNRAGLNPYGQGVNPVAQVANTQNSEMAQMSMMLGGNQQNNGNNNALNMIPYMLAQKNNGGTGSAYSPQLMQAMIMNSMLPDMNFNTKEDK